MTARDVIRFIGRACVLVGAAAMLAPPLAAQTSTGTVRGTVTGDGGVPVGDAQVAARNVESGVTRGT